jgi:hypothetical protein
MFSKEEQKTFRSPIPPHLTEQERIEWEKEIEWERQQLERRKKEGFWKYPKSN